MLKYIVPRYLASLYLIALFNFGKEVLGAHFEKQDVGTCLKLVKDVLVKKKKKSTVVYLRISQMRQSIPPSQLSGNYEAKARWWLA